MVKEKTYRTAQTYIEKVREQAQEIEELQKLLSEKTAGVEKTLAKLRSYKRRGIVEKINTYVYRVVDWVDNTTIKSIIDKMLEQADFEKYTGASGRVCYRTHGSIEWYFLLCSNHNLKPKWVEDFYYTAKGNGFYFDFVESDIILAIE